MEISQTRATSASLKMDLLKITIQLQKNVLLHAKKGCQSFLIQLRNLHQRQSRKESSILLLN